MDVLTKEQRSFNMSRIRSKNTKPELFVFAELEKLKIEFEKHSGLPGKPDVVFHDKKIALFIDGEYWHGRYLSKIKYRLSEYWITKITNNRKRDRKRRKELKELGWHILRIWDDDIKKHPAREINRILRAINNYNKK